MRANHLYLIPNPALKNKIKNKIKNYWWRALYKNWSVGTSYAQFLWIGLLFYWRVEGQRLDPNDFLLDCTI
ncbi:MAG: hypothetical protein N0E48_01225, partial [Candidatus Thiodiazotropha endolucinida]|nr:hypothetical protein [Candidatus Thiodiazotropha taylori]MCW4341991.1 hypothetical protein [Candidatus Thiodiazotropha endolucinida]